MAKKKVYTVSKRSKKQGWKVKDQSGKVVAKTDTKPDAVKSAATVARTKKSASVVVRKADGRIQEERTYPRSADPRKTKG